MTGPLLPRFSTAGVMSVRDTPPSAAGPQDDDEFIAAVLARFARWRAAAASYDEAIETGTSAEQIVAAGEAFDAACDENPTAWLVAFAEAVLVYAQPPWDETIIGTRIAEAAAQHLGRGDTRAIPLLPGGAS